MPVEEQNIIRVKRTREQAREGYNKMSRWYDLIGGQSEKKYRNEGLRMLDVREGERVLEIGYGTGHVTVALARLVSDSGKVNGIDISDGMLGVATGRVSRAGLDDRVELQRGDASELPYEDDMFDAVFMSFTLELFDNSEIPGVLEQCMRVLKPGGRIVVVSMSAYGAEGAMVRLYKWAHRNIPSFVDCRPIYARKALV